MYGRYTGYARKRYAKPKVGKRKMFGVRTRVNAHKAIIPLYNKVKKIEKTIIQKRIPLYLMNNAQSITANLTQPFTIQKLCKFSDDVPIFGTDANDLEGSKVLFKSITLKMNCNLENLSETEEETTRVEMYIVSLKDEANDIFSVVNGDITLTSGIHYWQFGPTGIVNGGYTFLNKKYFNIIKHKRFELTNYGASLGSSAAQNTYGTNWHMDCKIPINKIIRAPLSNSTNQTWKTLVCPRDPSENYYIIWFNDNFSTDGESPRCNSLALKKFEKLDN